MEMNTRLQVEHPVTESITGQDLVEWQLRIASGEPLPLSQDQLKINGCSMEARLYAENPATGFLPSTGPLTHFQLPDDLVRVDTAVEEGGEVTPFYDPMIAKLIAHAPTREAAAAQLAEACRRVEIWPVKANAGFLARCLDHPDFVAGDVDTGFIEARLDALVPKGAPPEEVQALAAAAAMAGEEDATDEPWSPWSPLDGPTGFRLNAPAQLGVRLEHGGQVLTASAEDADFDEAEERVLLGDDQIVVFADGEAFEFHTPRAAGDGEDGASGDGAIRSPMPGKIVAVAVEQGAEVKKGAPLVTLEAMKMEHALAAPFDGKVAELKVAAGDQVSEGVLLVKLEHG
jgi:propionyl-CoA carboxylase alpha chain/3-methylcrotonyl-CoA carboxylase alpha subunit